MTGSIRKDWEDAANDYADDPNRQTASQAEDDQQKQAGQRFTEEDAVHTFLEPAPQADEQSACHSADGIRRSDNAQHFTAMVRAFQNERREQRDGNADDKVQHNEENEQTEKSAPREDVREAVQRLFQHPAAPGLTFDRFLRLWDANQRQGKDGEEESRHVDNQHPGQGDDRQQQPRQDRREHRRTRFHQRHHPVGAAVIFLRHHCADRRRIRGPLEGIAESVDDRCDIQMPDLQRAEHLQNKDSSRGKDRGQVADHHHQLAVMPIHHHACDGGEQKKRHHKCRADDTQGGGAAGFLICPNGQRELRHARGEDRDQLSRPDDGKPGHAGRF